MQPIYKDGLTKAQHLIVLPLIFIPIAFLMAWVAFALYNKITRKGN